MLRKFRVKNFLSFRDWQTLDLTVAANAPEMPGRFVRSVPGSKDRFPTFVAIFGANASGKTNLLRALDFLIRFVQSSHSDPPNEQIPLLPFFGKGFESETVEFEVDIDWAFSGYGERVRLNYRLTISPDLEKVLEEDLSYFPGSRPRRLFVRRCQDFKFGSDFQIRRNDPSVEKIKQNSSVISTLAQFNHFASAGIVKALSSAQSNVNGILEDKEPTIEQMSKYYSENSEVLKQFIELSRKFDTGIEDVEIIRSGNDFVPQFYHSGIDGPILDIFESHGTSKIFNLFPMIYFALKSGGIVVVDELDNAIHSLLLPEIIELFVDAERNPKNAQLIAACQNPSILQFLEKEEVFFAEKKANGATEIYGLKEIKGVRRESNIYANYLAGAFGGVPKVA